MIDTVRTLRTTLLCLPAIAFLVGCSKSESPSGTTRAADVNIDVAAVNALVPADLKSKLEFEKREIVLERGSKTTYTLAGPKGWTQTSKMFGNLEPGTGAGMFNKLGVGSNCDGACTPKDWEKVSDKVNFQPLAKGKIVKDEKTKGRRVMIVEGGSATAVNLIVAWWEDGASKYWTCTAQLEDDLKAAMPAFEKACQAVGVSGDD